MFPAVTMVTTQRLFHWADYFLFALSLALTVAIGIGYAIKNRWAKQSAESFLVGNRGLNPFLSGMSYVATYYNAVLIIGAVSEFYYLGVELLWYAIPFAAGAAYTAVVTIPKIRNTGDLMTSAYQVTKNGISYYIIFIYHVTGRITRIAR